MTTLTMMTMVMMMAMTIIMIMMMTMSTMAANSSSRFVFLEDVDDFIDDNDDEGEYVDEVNSTSRTRSISSTTHSTATSVTATATAYDDNYRLYKMAVNIYLVGAMCALGILGNVVSILVLGRERSIRKTTRFLLQMLAVSDTAYLVACLAYQTAGAVLELTDWAPAVVQRRWPYVEVYAWPLASIAQTSTVWLVVLVTADRYVAICRPLHAPQYSTVSRSRTAVVAIWAVSVAYNVPRFFEREISIKAHPSVANATRLVTSLSDLRTNAAYFLVYKVLLFGNYRLQPFSISRSISLSLSDRKSTRLNSSHRL